MVVTREWPTSFLDSRTDLSQHHLSNVFDDGFASVADVLATLSAIGTSRQVGPNLRVIVDGRACGITRRRVIDEAPESGDESLESWASRLFGEQPFWVVINEVEVFNEELASRAAREVWPIIEAHRSWFGGLHIALLIGRSGFTPLGAHVDTDCRWNFHFHLGPAPKSVTVWPAGELDAQPLADLLAPDRILDRGTSATLAAGDLFVLPCQTHHLARYGGLAATLVVSFKLLSERALLESAFARLLDQHVRTADAIPLLGADDTVPPLDVDEARLGDAVQTQRLLRQSNLGLTVRKPDPGRRVDWTSDTFRIVAPFTIVHREIGDGQIEIMARGHRIAIGSDPGVPALLDQFNAGQPVAAASIPAGPPRAVAGLLFSYSAIQRQS